MPNFKAGDKIKMLEDCSGIKKGEICLVRKTQDGDLCVYSVTSINCCTCEEKWELIEDSTAQKTPQTYCQCVRCSHCKLIVK